MKVFITGAASGIGFATAVRLAKLGHYVYIGVHRENQVKPSLEKVRSYGLEERISVLAFDITDAKSRHQIFDLDIDCLINNAALGVGGALLDLSIDAIRYNFEVNVFFTIELIQLYAASLFLKKKSGKVVIISSLAGIVPIPFMSSYSATKASLITFATALRREVKMLGIDISIKLVEPGIYWTGFNEVMIDNQEKYLKEQAYFSSFYSEIRNKQRAFFQFFGKKSLASIEKKMVSASLSHSNKFIYRAPILQVLGAKLYLCLFK